MAQVDELPLGWQYPIYHATLKPRQYLGVPEGLCVANGLISALTTLLLFGPACVAGAVIHLVAKGLTALDPYWVGIIGRYIQYKLYYRG